MMKICYSIINNINIKYIYIIRMLRNATVRELSQCFAFCRFCHFLIYISVRFVYISFTFLFTLSFSFLACQNPRHAILIDNLRHERHLIDFKRFFSAMSLAKTCQHCRQNGKSLILKGFLITKRVMSLIYRALPQIIITLAI